MAAVPASIAAGDIFPDTAQVTQNRLVIGGCDVNDLAKTYGTPLYVFDEASVLNRARAYRSALETSYGGKSTVCFASKAYCAPWVLRLIAQEGLGLDVVSGGELHTAKVAGFPPDRVYFHGNNKEAAEIEQALRQGIGRFVVDSLDEIELLSSVAQRKGKRAAILLRVGPGVDPHATHAHIATGQVDSKFGLGIHAGAAEQGVRAALAKKSLDLRGFHFHIGSQLHEIEPYKQAIDVVFDFAVAMRDQAGLDLREMSPGGGFGVRYTTEDPTVKAADMIAEVATYTASAAKARGFALPEVTIEPGRSMIANTAVALYRVGSIKKIPGVRTYVSVDGGMADNIRPTAYGSKYSSVLANRVGDGPETTVAIAGKYCESGDVLIRDAKLPMPRVDDLVAIPTAGAYHLSMASNYNMALKPAVVVVAGGKATLVRRRETFADLLAAEDPA